MGEIADALKKANAERDSQSVPAPPDASPTRAPAPPQVTAAPPAAEARPRAVSEAARPLVKIDDRNLTQLEHHRHLALRLRAVLEQHGNRSLAVVSALRDEGKTTVACTLAVGLASLSPDRRVALIDLDLRNPSVARHLGLRGTVGIELVLMGRARLDEVRIPVEHPALDVYPTLEPQRAAHELLAGLHLGRMLSDLEARYATVIIDTPPSLLVPDASLILSKGAAGVAVARVGRSRVRRFNEMLELLPQGRIVGKILNGAPTPKHQRDYYYGEQADDDDQSSKSMDAKGSP